MNYFAIFRGFIVTANPDNSIPLNAKCCGVVKDEDAVGAEALVNQANIAARLIAASRAVVGDRDHPDARMLQSRIDALRDIIQQWEGGK